MFDLCVADLGGCVHVVRHDCRDTQELDPGSNEKCTSSQRPRRGKVQSELQLVKTHEHFY